jgi:hypothetical protein
MQKACKVVKLTPDVVTRRIQKTLDFSEPPIQIGGFWFFIAIFANASEDKAFVVSDSTMPYPHSVSGDLELTFTVAK